MRRYLKLVHFELDRFAKIYLGLIIMTIVAQLAGVIVKSRAYLRTADYRISEEYNSLEAYLRDYGKLSFDDLTSTLWFAGPIILCIAALIFYCFLIWYRDWFGKNTFIYRLLMLPTARIHIYLTKATAIFLMVLGLVSLQLLLLPLEVKVFEFTVPASLRADLGVRQIINNFWILSMLVPRTFMTFVLAYGTGFMSVFVLFTIILFERSFRWRGAAAGILYGAFSIVVFFAPFILEWMLDTEYLYPLELLIVEVIMGLIVIAMSIGISHYLIKNRITV